MKTLAAPVITGLAGYAAAWVQGRGGRTLFILGENRTEMSRTGHSLLALASSWEFFPIGTID
jgi:hypothetical protein